MALVGDASGSVDAITGEGLCLLFQQAVALAGALEAGDLRVYQAEHRRIGKRPELMADLMLMLDRRGGLRRRAHPRHGQRIRACSPACWPCTWASSRCPLFSTNGLALGWHMLTV